MILREGEEGGPEELADFGCSESVNVLVGLCLRIVQGEKLSSLSLPLSLIITPSQVPWGDLSRIRHYRFNLGSTRCCR